MPAKDNLRKLESGIHTELSGRLSYGGYLQLESLLSAQQPLSDPPHHDEMLFIIQHQVAELWMKLILHEITSACQWLREDTIAPCAKVLARVKMVQRQLFEQWAVLETLTPTEYAQFRGVLERASGFQSAQYRRIEFILGNKNVDYLKLFRYDEDLYARVKATLEAPSLYDEFLCYLARHDHAVPAGCVQRDWCRPHQPMEALVPVFTRIYRDPRRYWAEYELCEKLVDIEESFQLWRFRHMKTVERIIGHKQGTGGSSGVDFLKRALELCFFPELLSVRTEIGN